MSFHLLTGFFVDIELSLAASSDASVATVEDVAEKVADASLEDSPVPPTPSKVGVEQVSTLDETEHLMLKLKFLPYKVPVCVSLCSHLSVLQCSFQGRYG